MSPSILQQTLPRLSSTALTGRLTLMNYGLPSPPRPRLCESSRHPPPIIRSHPTASFLNTPHNPIGKVFDEDELRQIGNIAEEFDLIILSDEVVRLHRSFASRSRLATYDHLILVRLHDIWKGAHPNCHSRQLLEANDHHWVCWKILLVYGMACRLVYRPQVRIHGVSTRRTMEMTTLLSSCA